MTQYVWHPQYAEAMLATSPDRRQISVAELAIQARLRDSLTNQPVSRSEITAIRYALRHLRLLKREMERLDPKREGKPIASAITPIHPKQHAA